MDCGTLVPDSPLSISEDTGTLASALQGCGYTTAAIGKWHLGIGLPPRTDWSKPLAPGPLSVGFDSFFGIPSNPASPPGCYVRNDSLVPGECKPEEITPRCTDEAVEFIGRQAGRIQPFFLCFTPTAVHDPVAPSERFRGQSGIGEYGDFVSELDWSVGRLLDELEEQKLTTDTLVLFLSDNGADIDVSAWAPPGQLDESKKARTQSWSSGHLSNGPFRSGKQSIYDGGVRVPFIASWPGRIPRSTSTDGIISFTDIYASVLALAGVEADYIPPESVDRSDLFLRPGDGKHPARAPILVKSHPNIYALRSQRWKYIRHTDFLSPAVPGWWVSMFGQENEDQLYDMEADPGETVNVLDENPKVVEEMGQALDRLLAESRGE
jgi:arylsulfatase A-like enzyme